MLTVDLVAPTSAPPVLPIEEGGAHDARAYRPLEHARIYHFANGGDPEHYIGSADWRPRNLRRRVEVVTPVSDPGCRSRLDAILDAELADPTAWELQSDGSYRRRTPPAGADRRSSQERLLELAGATP